MVIYKNVMVKMVVLIALVLIFELQHFLTVTKVNQNLVKHFNKVFHHSIETKVVDLNWNVLVENVDVFDIVWD